MEKPRDCQGRCCHPFREGVLPILSALRHVQSKRACTPFRPQLIDGAFQGIPQKVTRFLRLWSKVRQHAVQQDGFCGHLR